MQQIRANRSFDIRVGMYKLFQRLLCNERYH